MILSPPIEKVAVTPWETMTRFSSLLGGRYPLVVYPPQETKLNPVLRQIVKTSRTRMRFFKPKAPNDMKKGDLNVKSWIITDPELIFAWRASDRVSTSAP
jgi:hypothetical protein